MLCNSESEFEWSCDLVTEESSEEEENLSDKSYLPNEEMENSESLSYGNPMK